MFVYETHLNMLVMYSVYATVVLNMSTIYMPASVYYTTVSTCVSYLIIYS